jgi:hypothetical protein
VCEDLGADLGDVYALVGALEECDAELGLKLSDLAAEGWLADIAGLRGASEVSVVGESNEVAKVLKVHGDSCRIGWFLS